MGNLKFNIFLALVFLMSYASFSQTKEQLEAQRKKYRNEITRYNKLLFKEIGKKENALQDLKDINQKIQVRNKLIKTIQLEAKLLSKGIKTNERKIENLKKNLEALKTDYASMIYKSYKSKSQQSRMMFLLSSQNFYQAYKRLEYMKQYASFRKKQGEEILVQANFISKLNDSLRYQKSVKDTLIFVEKNQKDAIISDKKQQESLITTIKKKEGKYKREIKKNVREEKIVAERIDKIVREAIAKANKKVANKPKNSKKNEFILSPEAKALAAKFELNKGKLPWPVQEGIVVRKFGKQSHPLYPGIEINGTGLHIVTSQGSDAEAIFNGEVLNILVGSGGTKNVMIRHGNYITSYNHLENAYVKKGDKITTGQKIGRIFTDKVSGKTTLIFVLLKNTYKLNPASWMLKR
ncbi:peptidoglycan DD-metalloendopeptidase family protein [Polaribacter litorisediminis]|uniref:murein hydrolase activator EnvC family protein n=1 Tax=Polaribacter litorisediminis TaxID=1908341 RepID=UPI001CBDD359|nr:peptidoglycan DD-metalloendopeptidase family protein [Polaribacter litorisediminis]UAM98237.1 peptidoglycan DD-metalloendopeptidase family protein [Polaribacter litorisediminis]